MGQRKEKIHNLKVAAIILITSLLLIIPLAKTEAKSVVSVDHSNATIKITTYIEYYTFGGEGLDTNLLKKWEEVTEQKWGQNRYYKCYKVILDVAWKTRKATGKKTKGYHQVFVEKINAGENFRSEATMTEDWGGNGEVSSESGYGQWYYEDTSLGREESAGAAAHEIGHFLGLDDEYIDVDSDGDGDIDSYKPGPGYSPDSIMYDHEKGNFLQRHIDGFVDKLKLTLKENTTVFNDGSTWGHIKDDKGKLVPGADIVVTPYEKEYSARTMQTEGLGGYDFRDLICGKYNIEASKACYTSQANFFELTGNKKFKEINFILPKEKEAQCKGFTLDETIVIPEMTSYIKGQAESCNKDRLWKGTWHQEAEPPESPPMPIEGPGFQIIKTVKVTTDHEFFFYLPDKAGEFKVHILRGTSKGTFGGQTLAEVKIDCALDEVEVIASPEIEKTFQETLKFLPPQQAEQYRKDYEARQKEAIENAKKMCKGELSGMGSVYYDGKSKITFKSTQPSYSVMENIEEYKKECEKQ